MYSSLEPEKMEIRLVVVKPGGRSDKVQCRLIKVSLNDCPKYEALSYVWGEPDPINQDSILLEGKICSVTRNLGSALTFLRSPDQDRTLWVDAICINQADISERNTQVKLMGVIYKTAIQVVSWLGTELEDIADSYWVIKEAVKYNFSSQWMMDMTLTKPSLQRLRTLASHLNRHEVEYWRRIWITQELAFAQNGVLQCRDITLPFTCLVRLKAMLGQLMATDDGKLELLPFLSTHCESYQDLVRVLESLADISAPFISNPIGENARGTKPLLRLLVANRWKMASDPRDKVYALLGLSDLDNNSHPGVKIDYSRTVRQVYMGAAQAIIEITSNLDILCESVPKLDSGDAGHLGLPSWTPNWEMGMPTLLRPMREKGGVAGDSLASTDFLSNDGSILRTGGFRIGTVGRCGVTNPIREHDYTKKRTPEFYISVSETISQWHELLTTTEGYFPALDHLFIQTITTGEFKDEISTSMVLDTHQKNDLSEFQAPILDWVQSSCQDSLFFLINHSRSSAANLKDAEIPLMGIGRSRIREGDIICIFLGCCLPIILRPNGYQYTFVSAVYVPNLMGGIGLKGLEEDVYKLESFELI